ncbi:ferrous iron transport protein B [Puteibacter caeruleilacunae]|nr:ferrous iron transport protein B [Puteibacter caeruleilacunae]
MRLSEVENNETVIITKVRGYGAFRKRISEMGFVKGKEVQVVKNAPLKDPIEYKVMDYNVSLRRNEAKMIEVITREEAKRIYEVSFEGVIDDEILKTSATEKGRNINIALVGNPNCGKTSLFNFASGSNEHVGNYSGVTVDAKEALFTHKDYRFNLIDLPGTYSLTAYTPEEKFVRKFILDETPDIVINVVDASNLERNLYLTTQLIDMDVKVIIALNMYDELEASGASFDYQNLAEMIGIPIIPTVCIKGEGVEELFNKAIQVYEDKDPIVRHIHINYGEEVEKSIRRLRDIIKHDRPITVKASSRFMVIKLLEKDEDITKILEDYSNYKDIRAKTEREIKRLELLYDEDSETIITDSKYGFVNGALKETYKHGTNLTAIVSERIDKVVTNKYLALPLFLLFMYVTFYCTFNLGAYPADWIDAGISMLVEFVGNVMPDGMFKDLLTDGIISGLGSVLVFVPNIVILFLFISLMEDTGYMARAAFIMDKIMHRFGLHGRSFIPLLMGFGCNVPAIMATRTLRNRSDRMLTMLITPFMSCSARLPVYILFISAFFPNNKALYLIGLYVGGIVLALILSQIFKRVLFKTQESPFVMELPPYRFPTVRNIIIHMWDKTQHYLKKIGGVILIAVIIIWALGYFPRHSAELASFDQKIESLQQTASLNTGDNVEQKVQELQSQRELHQLENSYLGQIGHFIAPVMKPLGFDWKMSISLLSGVAAKEIVVSTMGVLYQSGDDTDNLETKLKNEIIQSGERYGQPVFDSATALAFLVFVLIYFPCIAVIATIRRESGKVGWAVFTMVYTSVLAWIMAWLVQIISSML